MQACDNGSSTVSTWGNAVDFDPLLYFGVLGSGGGGGAANNGTPRPGIMDPFVAQQNAQFNQCVANGGQLAIFQGAMDTVGKDSSATKAAVNIMGAALDVQKRCLKFYPLAALSPNYRGMFLPGDLVDMF
jgi:hypothetical protein